MNILMTFGGKWHKRLLYLKRLSVICPSQSASCFLMHWLSPYCCMDLAHEPRQRKRTWNVFKLQKRAPRVILYANIRDRSEDLFRRLDWLPFKDEVNLQQCSLILRRIRNEDDCPDYITKLLTRNSDPRSDNRASRYGRFNLVCPFYNRETEGGRTFNVRGATLWPASWFAKEGHRWLV